MFSNHCLRWRQPVGCAEEAEAEGVEFEVILGLHLGPEKWLRGGK